MRSEMEQRAYHGKIDAEEMGRILVVQFNQGETRAQWMRGQEGRTIVQIQNRRMEASDPKTAVTLHITPSGTGVVVSMAEQQWLGVAADLARTGLMALLNPWSLIGEIDNVARNVRGLRLREEVWRAIETYCRSMGAGTGAAALLQHVTCPYCGTPNALGETNCKACRAPLSEAQPVICGRCGFMNEPRTGRCANCKTPL